MLSLIFWFSGLSEALLNLFEVGKKYLQLVTAAVKKLADYMTSRSLVTPDQAVFCKCPGGHVEFVMPAGTVEISRDPNGKFDLNETTTDMYMQRHNIAVKLFMTKAEFMKSSWLVQMLYLNSYIVVKNGYKLESRMASWMRDTYEREGFFYTSDAHLITKHAHLFQAILNVAVPNRKESLSKTIAKRWGNVKTPRIARMTNDVIKALMSIAIEDVPALKDCIYVPKSVFLNATEFWKANPELSRDDVLKRHTHILKWAGAHFKGMVVLYDGSTIKMGPDCAKNREFWWIGLEITEWHGDPHPSYISYELLQSLNSFM